MQEVREERTGWRDARISDRHREWGWDCPAVDLDFLLLEYDHGKAVAIVEFKHEQAKIQHASHPSYRAMIDLGNRAGIPVFACRYADDFSWFRATPLNENARYWLPEKKEMTELEWVSLLYRIRGREIPEDLFALSEVEV
jgi:hypothetical protein